MGSLSQTALGIVILTIAGLAQAGNGPHCTMGLSAVCILARIGLVNTGTGGGPGQNLGVVQTLRDAMYHTSKSDSTSYGNGDHVICVGSSIALNIPYLGKLIPVTLGGLNTGGGICVFPTNLEKNTTISLGAIKKLSDQLLDNNCNTCGMIPIDYPKRTSDEGPIIKFDYVSNPKCTGECITNADIVIGGTTTSSSTAPTAASETVVTQTSTVSNTRATSTANPAQATASGNAGAVLWKRSSITEQAVAVLGAILALM